MIWNPKHDPQPWLFLGLFIILVLGGGILGISLAHPTPPRAEVQDCVPKSLHLLGYLTHNEVPLKDWTAACKADETGTDAMTIIPTWEKLTYSPMVCIYTPDPDPAVSNPLQDQILRLRPEGRYDPSARLRFTTPYLWIGFHDDPSTSPPSRAAHCAIIYLRSKGIHMISPNSLHANGTPLEEDFTFEQFFPITIAVFQVIDPFELHALK